MLPVKENIIRILPPRAGFMKLQPMPPKSILTTRMAKMSPTISCQMGIPEGTLKAISMPVTTAEPSRMVISHFRAFSQRNSQATQTAVEITVRNSGRIP